jgi:hypothetical protein
MSFTGNEISTHSNNVYVNTDVIFALLQQYTSVTYTTWHTDLFLQNLNTFVLWVKFYAFYIKIKLLYLRLVDFLCQEELCCLMTISDYADYIYFSNIYTD